MKTAQAEVPVAATAAISATVMLAALGYFVDIYDLILFSIVRVGSLRAIGIPEAQLLSKGVLLLNMQMSGMLVGGIVWGVLGDKKGRLSVLFGSIFLYSAANIANGLVGTIGGYAFWRFVAGFGLAGELGAGITLVSEIMPKETRGYGTMLVAAVGVMGGIVAGLIGDSFTWRTAYFIGGGLGLVLLALRIGVYESGMFNRIKESQAARGDFRTLATSPRRALKYLCCILVGVPIWFVIGILVTYAPEFGRALGLPFAVNPARAIGLLYAGTSIGSFLSGGLSQWLGNRKGVATAFIGATAVVMTLYLLDRSQSPGYFYFLCLALGITTGYWAVFVTMASEQFGTNIRATVTTTAPNFVRGSLVPMNFAFQAAKGAWGILPGAGAVGGTALLLALGATLGLDETHGKDLNYVE